jgi:hypothetical protein
VLLARTIGGLCTGDLNRLDWGAFGSELATLMFVRRKTHKKKRGKRAGETKMQATQSYASRLRWALRLAGITRHALHQETATTRATHFPRDARGLRDVARARRHE